MFKSKITFSMFCMFFLVLALLSACSNSSENTSNNNDSKTNDATEQTDSEEPFEISIMTNLHTPETPDKKIQELIEEKTGYKLDIQWVPDDNYDERLNTAFATGSFPDSVRIGFAQMNQFKDAIRNDQFWEIGPYLDQFENLNNLNDEIMANTTIDGKIYGVYQGRPLSRQGIIYRKDWADHLGLEAPTTTDEFMEMVRAFTEDDPNDSGKDDTIGLADRSDLIYGGFKTIASWFGTPHEWGVKDGELLPEFMFDEYMQTLDFYREMHSNRYINQDFPVTSKTDQVAMVANGTAGVYVGSMQDVNTIYNDAVALNPDVEFDVHNHVEGPHGEFGVWAIPGFSEVMMFPKSSVQTEEDLLKILGFYDKLASPDVMNTLYWGIEGEHYEVQDGKAVYIADQAIIDREIRPYLTMEIGEPETTGRYELYTDYEVRQKADELVLENNDYLISDPTVTLDSDTFIQDGDRLKQLIDDATIQYILGQIDKDGFEKAVENWKSQGGNAIIQEFNASYQAQS
ncbi:extracellular solute-binding protein [Alkalihalobacillus sp. LMS39]|uniref:extracellular solute-binding protein n=1 Tax=Alkalihalobacillus sp. LMS39 TaxID=2924032 RepID=UPI001FB3F843|nr:extracellular solute-binding protein [Alkalihalobacillus sp. LMS39]UOE93054.1 extracellular solute-binding protein [Alkalihalobacillus sp. LMS39]